MAEPAQSPAPDTQPAVPPPPSTADPAPEENPTTEPAPRPLVAVNDADTPIVDILQNEALSEERPTGTAAKPPTPAVPGWYIDPNNERVRRYWDGIGWVGNPWPGDIPVPEGFVPEERPPGCVKAGVIGDDGSIHQLWIKPQRMWRASTITAYHQAHYDLWAQEALCGGEFAKWLDIDPVLGTLPPFFAAMWAGFGAELGKASSTSGRSSSTR